MPINSQDIKKIAASIFADTTIPLTVIKTKIEEYLTERNVKGNPPL